MLYRTIIQCEQILKDLASAHPLVRSYKYADTHIFSSDAATKYPAVNVDYSNSTLADKTVLHTFSVTIHDVMISGDTTNEKGIHSMTADIAIALCNSLTEKEVLDGSNISLQAFREGTGDMTAGVAFAVNFMSGNDVNPCSLITK